MVRDPLYRKIEERLGGKLDPILFERCANDLLGEVYPGLVPITGGDDGGMDGAISDETGEVLPLIVTTAEKDLANLTGSLNSYQRHGGRATEAVFATSQALTSQKRRNREARAKELGFTLRNIHDRADFTGRLYRSSKWRLELLGLPGDPPALSALPRSVGPHRTGELVGRSDELDRLRRHRGDALLVGQPGVGKTALLETLATEGRGLFTVSEDPGQIADAFRDNPVQFVFVDDAHFREPLIDLLGRLREELGFDFGIVASTWPSRERILAQRLYLSDDKMVFVKGLSREQAATIIRAEHAQLPDPVIGKILDDSQDSPADVRHMAGTCRPGLAMTLARHTARMGIEELRRGGLLIDGLMRETGLAPEGLDYLGTLAMGGGVGMTLGAVARALGQPEVVLRKTLEALSGTGTLSETPGGALAVRPRALRHALVARTYFGGALGLSPEPAMEEVEDAVSCTEALVGALGRGAAVPHGLIRDRLQRHSDAGVGNRSLEAYAETGRAGAIWVLEEYPGLASSVAPHALRYAPEWALGRLVPLVLEGGDADDIASEIETWVRAGVPGADAVDRRRQLLRALEAPGVPARDAPEAATRLVSSCFSLKFFRFEGDAVTVKKFTMPMSSLTASDVRRLAKLWPTTVELLRNLGVAGILSSQRIIRHWTIGVRTPGKLPETIEASRSEVGGMLELAVDTWGGEPGFLHWANGIVREHGLIARIPAFDDPLLAELFPTLDQRVRAFDGKTNRFDQAVMARRSSEERQAARRLAREWRDREPGVVADRMLRLRRQAKLSGYSGTRPLDLIAVQLAEMVDDPSAWLETFAIRPVPEAWIGPFLAAAVAADPLGEAPWRTLERLDEHGVGMWAGLQVGLYLRDPPRVAVQRVIAAARENVGILRDAVHWRDVPDEWRIRLLKDRDETVRGETAFALWDLHDRRPPPGHLGVAWRDATVTCGTPELLHDVLRRDSDAAIAWILHHAEESSRRRTEEIAGTEDRMDLPPSPEDMRIMTEAIVRGLSERDTRYSLDVELLTAAADAIGREDRRRLLQDISAKADPRFFGYLVRDDPELEGIARERGLTWADLEFDAW